MQFPRPNSNSPRLNSNSPRARVYAPMRMTDSLDRHMNSQFLDSQPLQDGSAIFHDNSLAGLFMGPFPMSSQLQPAVNHVVPTNSMSFSRLGSPLVSVAHGIDPSLVENHLQGNTAAADKVTPASTSAPPVEQYTEPYSQKKRRAGKETAVGKISSRSSGPKSKRAKGAKKVTIDLEADSDSNTVGSDADDGPAKSRSAWTGPEITQLIHFRSEMDGEFRATAGKQGINTWIDELFDNRAAVQKQVHVDARGSNNPSEVEFNTESGGGEETCAEKQSSSATGTRAESIPGAGDNRPNVIETSSQSTVKPGVLSQKNERRRSVGEKLCVLLENMVDNSTKIVENSSKMSQHIEKSLVFFEKLDEHMANLIAKI
ncbi:hypothetical protein R1sor_018720 [Riccia sorocarpa]|uniref:Uncharacterized protein n=1 Tax=Riccia sorocarpa TaxID=122646 RepID=A0ABD3IAK5_9MARC